MGGVAVGVAIEPTGGPDAATPSELQSLLWTLWIRPLIRYVLRRPANQQVLSYYLDAEASDGPREGLWAAGARELLFGFHDAGGCRMSMYAALHWTEMAFALALYLPRDIPGWAEARGYRFVSPPDLSALLGKGPAHPLVELRNELYCVAPPRAGLRERAEIFTDEGAGMLSYDALRPAERARVDSIAGSHRCACELCKWARARLSRDATKAARAAQKAAMEKSPRPAARPGAR